jgi:hypothetical protein
MKSTNIALTIAMASALTLGSLVSTAAADKDIKLSGCLVRAENGSGYLLTNAPGESVWDRAREVPVEPGPAGTTGRMGSVFYWLDNNSDLKEHIGHQVDIDGELKGDLNDGQIKVDRKANWTEMEVKSGERTLKARVPQSLFVYPASPGDGEPKINVLVRKVDVKKVSMRAASCDK